MAAYPSHLTATVSSSGTIHRWKQLKKGQFHFHIFAELTEISKRGAWRHRIPGLRVAFVRPSMPRAVLKGYNDVQGGPAALDWSLLPDTGAVSSPPPAHGDGEDGEDGGASSGSNNDGMRPAGISFTVVFYADYMHAAEPDTVCDLNGEECVIGGGEDASSADIAALGDLEEPFLTRPSTP